MMIDKLRKLPEQKFSTSWKVRHFVFFFEKHGKANYVEKCVDLVYTGNIVSQKYLIKILLREKYLIKILLWEKYLNKIRVGLGLTRRIGLDTCYK